MDNKNNTTTKVLKTGRLKIISKYFKHVVKNNI
jgi:hypothetical protein